MVRISQRVFWVAGHSLLMVALYLCQGLISGTIGMIPSLLADERLITPTLIAVLGAPMYAYTAKFLWAPAVDRLYSQQVAKRLHFHRRAQYVIPLQLVMACLFFVLSSFASGNEATFLMWVATGQGALVTTCVLFALAMSSATQDVAVDAWAVEGMESESLSSLAGNTQMIGLVLGSMLTQAFIVYHGQSVSDGPSSFSLTNYFVACGVVCLCACLATLVWAQVHRPSLCFPDGSEEAATPLVFALRKILSSARIRWFLGILFTRGWASPLNTLVAQQLQTRGVVDAAFLAQVRVVATVVSMITALTVTQWVLKRRTAASMLRFNSRLDLILTTLSVVVFITVVQESLESSGTAVFPLLSRDVYVAYIYVATLASSVSGAISFVSVVVIESEIATGEFAALGATVITLLNAAANFGYTLPGTLVLLLTSTTQSALSNYFGGSGVAATVIDGHRRLRSISIPLVAPHATPIELYASWERVATLIVSAVVVLWTLWLRRKYLVPSAKNLDACGKKTA